MTDVRCPMCGKANPADLEQCQYCQARLRPIWDSTSNDSQAGHSEEQDNDLPEWLKSLRLPQEGQPLDSAPEPEDRSKQPDWLNNLREQPVEPGDLQSDKAPDEQAGSLDDDTSEWLQGFLAEDDLVEAEDETVSMGISDASLQEEADWLSRIGSTPVEEERPSESAESLDWLTEAEYKASIPSSSGEQELYPSTDAQTAESPEPSPDWHAQDEADTLDWLYQEADQLAEGTQSGETPETSDELPAEEDLPSWLVQSASNVNEPVDSDEMDLKDSAELEIAGSPAQEPLAVTDQPAGEVQPVETDSTASLDQIASDEGTPDLPASETEMPEGHEPALQPLEDESTGISDEEPVPDAGSAEEPSADELLPKVLEEEPETSTEEAGPWLAGVGVAAIGSDMELGEELPEEDLGWLEELETTYGDLSPNAPDEGTPADGEAVIPGQEPLSTLPEWLTSSSEEEALVSEEDTGYEDELKPAEVPSWLQAMRPVGVAAAAASVLGDMESQQIEGAGPLAGLRGALPAEPDVSKVQKPPVYSIKLQVTDSQQLQAELLRGLIDSEGQSQELPGGPAIGSQQVIRLLIAILLIVPLLFVLLTGIPQLNLPALPPEVGAVGGLIDGLQPGSPVLLAVDYQPGFSGEMDAITTPVLQNLIDRDAYLAVVSTIATGPVQAEHLFSQMRISSGAPVQVNIDYAHLGYIPGGATGLLAFAQSPRTVFPTNWVGERVWDNPALQPVDMLEKFAMVVVATDNPDVARYWIEQVRPYLGVTPLVMVLSAQAEPMVRPYLYASPPQVQGLVGGLAGGAAYLGRSAWSGAATRFWSPYGTGALVAVTLMVLTGLVNLVSAQIGRQKQKTAGRKQP
jgi:hypothetical protein